MSIYPVQCSSAKLRMFPLLSQDLCVSSCSFHVKPTSPEVHDTPCMASPESAFSTRHPHLLVHLLSVGCVPAV